MSVNFAIRATIIDLAGSILIVRIIHTQYYVGLTANISHLIGCFGILGLCTSYSAQTFIFLERPSPPTRLVRVCPEDDDLAKFYLVNEVVIHRG